MGRKTVEINPEMGKRLSKWLSDIHMTQSELANELGYTQQHISNIITGKKNISVEFAQSVSQRTKKPVYNEDGTLIGYDTVNPQWLLCLSDFRSDAEKLTLAFQEVEHETEYLHAGLVCFASLSGYQVTIPSREDLSGLKLEDVFEKIKTGFTIEKDGAKISLSIDEMNRFENHLCDMIENELKFLFYMKGAGKNG